jgi:Uncharacterized protein conserved in bacteria
MSFLDEVKRLARPYEDEMDDELEGFDSLSRTRAQPASAARRTEPAISRNNVVSINTTTQVQVVIVKPEKFEQAAEVADHLCEKRTVLLNLEQTHKDVARRLLDFLAGVAYANDGKIKKVAVDTFIITPYNVDILGDIIDELESNGVHL